jgi:uncharacterized repeat protein (TIGR03803 family)
MGQNPSKRLRNRIRPLNALQTPLQSAFRIGTKERDIAVMLTSGKNVLSVALLFLCLGLVRAQATETILHNFTVDNVGCAYPVGQLVYSNGLFYGVAQNATNLAGSVFTMTATGTVKVLHEFTITDGYQPNAGLTLGTDGNFYGTTYGGGASRLGVVFKMTPAGVVTVLHSFTGTNVTNPSASDGANPIAGLLLASDGKLYGVTSQDGVNQYGTLFTLNTDGSGYSTLHNFVYANDDVHNPQTGLAEGPDGLIYGTAVSNYYQGEIYKITKDGSVFTIVHPFMSGDPAGGSPASDLIRASDGKLYGTCLFGGANGFGTVYQLDTSTGNVKPIWAFDGYTGAYPGHTGNVTSPYDQTQCRLLQGADGQLYGVTAFGGYNGFGTAFKVTTAGVCTVLTSFGPTDSNSTPNPLAQVNGNLYLTSYNGGSSEEDSFAGTGAALSISTKGQIKTLASFTISTAYPASGGLVQVGSGSTVAYYGVTSTGGEYGDGTIYKIDGSGNLTVLHALNGFLEEGINPLAGLVLARNGNLYGTTSGGGRYNYGTIFQITPAGAFKVIHHFRAVEGYAPVCPLAQGIGTDNALYGACTLGGPLSGAGTVFSIGTTGTGFKVLHVFSTIGTGGNTPSCTPLPDGQGNLYGTSNMGGTNNYGNVWKMSTTGANYKDLFDFYHNAAAGTFPSGASPSGPLTLIAGKIYGTTQRGGLYNNNGALIQIDPTTGNTVALYSFGGVATDGTIPMGGVLYDSTSGNLYGVCQNGGANNFGAVYAYNLTSGTMTILHAFSGVNYNNRALSDGASPNSGVIFGADGQLYGTTPGAGSEQYGLIFKQTTTP